MRLASGHHRAFAMNFSHMSLVQAEHNDCHATYSAHDWKQLIWLQNVPL